MKIVIIIIIIIKNYYFACWYESVSDEDCALLGVKLFELCSITLSLLFRKNFLVHMVLQAGAWNNPPLLLLTLEMLPTRQWILLP